MNTRSSASPPQDARLSADAFAALGVGLIAYIRPVAAVEVAPEMEANRTASSPEDAGSTAYEIRGADGALLARTNSLATAIGAIHQNNLEPTFAH